MKYLYLRLFSVLLVLFCLLAFGPVAIMEESEYIQMDEADYSQNITVEQVDEDVEEETVELELDDPEIEDESEIRLSESQTEDTEDSTQFSMADEYLDWFESATSILSNPNAQTIYDYLKNNMGLNNAGCAAVLANIKAESNFNPNDYYMESDGYRSYGICQWHLERDTALQNYCSNNGYDYTTLIGQLHYFEYEIKTSYYSHIYNKLRSVENTQQGAYDGASYFCIHFEVPANKYVVGAQRGEVAKQIFDEMVPPTPSDNLKFTNVAYPKTYLMNSKGWDLSSGTLESNYDLQSLKTEIVSTGGKVISSFTRTISGKSYSIRSLDTYESSDNGVHFSWIKEAGDYIWILTAKDGGNRTLTLEMPFTAVTSGSTSTSTASKEYVPEETKPTTHTHTPVTDVAVPATCETAGKTEGSHCSTCGQVITAQKSIPAKGHTSETVKGYASTCIKKGLSDGSKCSVCGKTLKEQTELPLAEHAPETVKGYASTCTSKGFSDGSKCSVCGKTLKEQTELPLAEHTPEIVPGWPATYTSTGMTDGSRCSVCGKELVAQEEIPMLGFHMTNNTTNNVIVGDVFRIVVDDRTVKSYKSSNKTVASVAKDGTVTAKKAGKAKITIKLKDKGKKKITLTVKVTDPTIPTAVYLDQSGTITVKKGETMTLTASVPEGTDAGGFKWKSSNKKVATVSNGVVTFKKKGRVTITATAVRGKKKAKVKFNVTK